MFSAFVCVFSALSEFGLLGVWDLLVRLVCWVRLVQLLRVLSLMSVYPTHQYGLVSVGGALCFVGCIRSDRCVEFAWCIGSVESVRSVEYECLRCRINMNIFIYHRMIFESSIH